MNHTNAQLIDLTAQKPPMSEAETRLARRCWRLASKCDALTEERDNLQRLADTQAAALEEYEEHEEHGRMAALAIAVAWCGGMIVGGASVALWVAI